MKNGSALALSSNAGFRMKSGAASTLIGSEEFVDQEIAMVLSLVEYPGCDGHLDHLRPLVPAKPTLTTHRDCARDDALSVLVVNPVPSS